MGLALRDKQTRASTDADSISSSTKYSLRTMSEASSVHKPSEQSPLLSPSSPKRGHLLELPRKKTPKWRSSQAITLLLIVVLILATCGDQLMESPQTRIIEAIICYRHYEHADPSKLLLGRAVIGPGAVGGVAEMDCKAADAVQSQLASLRGWQQLLDGFPSLIMAVPIGWAADKYGRKPFLTLAVISFVFRASWIQGVCWWWQAFDIRWTWFSSVHGLISGSSPVVSALFFVMLSDITPEAERAAIFLRVGAANIISALVMPPLSAWLMKWNPWIPSLTGTLLEVIAFFLCFIVPETLGYRHPNGSPGFSHPPTPSPESMPAPPDIAPIREPISADFSTRISTAIRESTSFIWADWRVPALILTFVGHILIASSGQLLLQYCSKRYGLSFSDATLLLSVRAGVNIILLFVILPWISTWVMQRFHLSGQRKDLYLSRASMAVVALGWFLVAASPNVALVVVSMAVASFGSGAMLLIRAFMTSLVPANHIARVYSVISIVDTLGAMFGAPVLAGLFSRGLAIGGGGIGLPFYFVSILSAAFTVILMAVRMRKNDHGYEPVQQADDE